MINTDDRELQQDLINQYFQNLWNERQLRLINELFTADFVMNTPGGPLTGRQVIQDAVTLWHEGFSDLNIHPNNTLFSGHQVVVEWTLTGRHTGNFLGNPPTGEAVTYSSVTIFTLADGMISEMSAYGDFTGFITFLQKPTGKPITEADFIDDFDGPASLYLRRIARGRANPSFKGMLANILRNQLGRSPIDNEPKIELPESVEANVKRAEISLRRDQEQVRALVYRPAGKGKEVLPIIMSLHGGAFIGGSPEAYDPFHRKLCHTTQAMVIAPAYRLAPEFPYPFGYEDALLAYRWIEHKADAVFGDPNRVLVLGTSAGANLALAAMLEARTQGLELPQGIATLTPVTDLNADHYDSFKHYAPRGLVFDDATMGFVRSAYARAEEWDLPTVSPIKGDFAKFPPLFMLVAGRDPFADENQAFVEHYRRAGNRSEVMLEELMPHGFHTMPGLTDAEDRVHKALAKFCQQIW